MSDFLKQLKARSQTNATQPVQPAAETSSLSVSETVPQGDNAGGRPRFAWQKSSISTTPQGNQAATSSTSAAIESSSAASNELVVADQTPTVQAESQIPSTSAASEVSGPVGFKAKLDALDGIIGQVSGIDPVLHGVVKARVKDIMLDLQSSPEMRELIIDRDVHNIMKFVQSSTSVADKHFEQVATKRVKKESGNKAAKNFDAALDQVLLQFGTPKATPSLDAISSLNTDNLPTKLNK